MPTFDTTINGATRTFEADGHESAVEIIRGQLGLTGTKLVCAGGVCGACTVHLDGEPVASCLTPATAMRDAQVTTVEGLADGDELHPVQRAFVAHDGLQCGYCTPGFVVDAVAFVDRWRAENGDTDPGRHVIADALAGHLCRCAAYEGIYRSVAAACRGEHDHGPTNALRIDGPDKVTGRAVYTADIYPENGLEAVIIRSPIAAGRVGPIDAGDTPIHNLLDDSRRVRYAGQPIAAIAAETLADARRLAAELMPDIEPLPFVLDPEEAKAEGAPLVYEDRRARKSAPNAAEGPVPPVRWNGNNRGPNPTPFMGTIAKKRLRKAKESNAAGLVELEIGTSGQLHTSFEPHCTVADWTDPDVLKVWTSTQAIDHVTHELAEHFELEADQIDVTADFIGGGFGSKLPVTIDMLAAIELSRSSGRPVRLVLDRREELTATGNRPGSASKVSILVAEDDGDMEAIVVDAESHTGVSINSPYGLLCMLVYDRSPRLAHDNDVVTNAPPGTPFRGPGGPTYAVALESAVDQAAHQLGRDPIELRQHWDGNERRQGLYEWAAGLDVWKNRTAPGADTGRYKRGVGVAAANWMYMVDPDTEVIASVEGGKLVMTTATQDMGTGSKTLLARAGAKVFDIDPHDVVVRVGRAGMHRPHGPASGGSRTTASIWPTALDAAGELLDEVGSDLAAAPEGSSASAHRGGDHGIRAVPVTFMNLQIGRGFSAALHMTEVEVDTLTGKTRALSVHGGLAIGVPYAPQLATSQCEGSIIQGIGLALYENQILDPHTGQTLTCNLEDYRIPQLGDTPEITIHFHEPGWEHVPGGGVGLGEVATISPAASVSNAIFNATGWRPTMLPVRPDRLLEGLR